MSDNINILVKLFETLKASSDKNEDATQQLIVQQLDLVGHIKNLPIDDLREALREHAKDSAADIDTCSETVENTSGDLMKELKTIGNKVNKMILIVVVAFSMLAGSYIFVRSISDNETTLREWREKIETSQASEHHKIALEVIDEIKKEMHKLREDDSEEDQ